MGDNYKKSKKSYQDTLSDDEIKKLLKDYDLVEDIFEVPINTHIRYFLKQDGQKKFRLGGSLLKTDKSKGYIVLTNGKTNWSVQVKDAILFKKQDIEDIRKYYEEKIHKYKKKIKKLEDSLTEIKKRIK